MAWFGEELEGKMAAKLDGRRQEPHDAKVQLALERGLS